MEDILVSHTGHKILHDFKNKLEARHKVKILMPELQKPELCVTGEIIFVKILGNQRNIASVQKFLKRKMAFERELVSVDPDGDQSVVVLGSDTEDDPDKQAQESISQPPRKKPRAEILEIDTISPAIGSAEQSPVCEVTSTTGADESVIIIENSAAEELIPICTNNQNKISPSSKSSSEVDVDVIVISSDEEDAVNQPNQLPILPRAISLPRRLRPIVIDGSNVARSHGKPGNTYSCKGIKICVDYFLERGHPQVTAFIPMYRRHCKKGPVVTTDQHILDELEKTQNVVYTPSRRLEGMSYSCYDDRFIVELASSNGGVILSNDNYKDLLNESPAFSETIKKRLLMYCFVGDKLMIPADPMGSKGPKLEDYLSFPPETPHDVSSGAWLNCYGTIGQYF